MRTDWWGQEQNAKNYVRGQRSNDQVESGGRGEHWEGFRDITKRLPYWLNMRFERRVKISKKCWFFCCGGGCLFVGVLFVYLFVVWVSRRLEFEVVRHPDEGDHADAGLGWGPENDQGFVFLDVQVEMPIRHPHGNPLINERRSPGRRFNSGVNVD